MRLHVKAKLPLVAACVAVGLVAQAYGATFPYSNDFSDPATASDFQVGTGNAPTTTWTITGGVYQHSFYDPTWGGSTSSRTIQVSGVAGQDFRLSTNVKVASKDVQYNDFIFGLAFLADSANQNMWSGDSYYLAQVRLGSGKPDTIMLAQNDGMYGALLPTTVAPEDVFGNRLGWTANSDGSVDYTLTVIGTYDAGSNLTLTASFSGGGNSASITSLPIAAANAKTGQFFGYTSTGFGSGGSVVYDNFSLTSVPEPASLGLLAVAVAGLMARRRAVA